MFFFKTNFEKVETVEFDVYQYGSFVAAESSDEVQKLFEKHGYKVDDGSYERPEVESFDEDEDFDY